MARTIKPIADRVGSRAALRYYDFESFEPVLLEPHGGEPQGFFLIRGNREQLQRLRSDTRFRTILTRTGLVVEALSVIDAYIGDALDDQMDLYGEQVAAQLSS
jgi:hypothetical protein